MDSNTLLFLIVSLLISTSHSLSSKEYNVVSLGAKPDGKTDSTKSFLSAWRMACDAGGSSTIRVPPGRYLLGAVEFEGECKSENVRFLIQGVLVAPADYNVNGGESCWIKFQGVSGVSLYGGSLDGQGSGLWECKGGSNGGCPQGATNLQFSNSKNILVQGLTSIDSQMFHIVISNSQNVKLQGTTITASGDSPNTDGIHVSESTGVTIIKANIKTGDDCISIGQGTTNLWIENIACGPGHGISIGSLGKESNEPPVQNVTVKTAVFTGTQNGVRIKTWGRPTTGLVQNVLFQGLTMNNVANPVIIDQQYCPNKNCPHQASGIQISKVTYKGIHGTSATKVAVNFDCSSTKPCRGIVQEDVHLTYRDEQAEAMCASADGSAYGAVQPSSCL